MFRINMNGVQINMFMLEVPLVCIFSTKPDRLESDAY